jgi:hypothetical protein
MTSCGMDIMQEETASAADATKLSVILQPARGTQNVDYVISKYVMVDEALQASARIGWSIWFLLADCLCRSHRVQSLQYCS